METINENFNRLREEDVGISEYINKRLNGFRCVLKHRYSDFLVNEIDVENNVVWLKTNEVKTCEILEESENVEFDDLIDQNFHNTNIITNQEDISKMKVFLQKYKDKELDDKDYISIEFIDDKNMRKAFHEKLREIFGFLDSETVNERQSFKAGGDNNRNSKKKIKKNDRETEKKQESIIERNLEDLSKKRIIIYFNKNNKTFHRRRKNFPQGKKSLHFVMLKRNLDTVQAISYLSRMIHRSNKSIKFAGNKDKRGITTQKVSAYSTLPEEISNLTKQKFWDKRIEISNFEFKEEDLRLGLLKGNQFSVVFRFIEFEDKSVTLSNEIDNSIKSLQELGFINYFGMQRFGVNSIPTHQVGIMVIKKQWKEAIASILNTQLIADALRQLGHKNNNYDVLMSLLEDSEGVNDLLKILPRYSLEHRVLNCLKKTGKNSYQTCFKSINRQLQVLYPHAYQSYIWNKTVSERINRFGLNLLVGDIVKKKNCVVEDIVTVDVNEDEVIEMEDENEIEAEVKEDKLKDKLPDKHFDDIYEFITEENLSLYSFNDLYVPIVGFEVKFPKNETFDIIQKYLKQDELALEDFEYQNVNFNSTGYFRKVLERPNELTFDLIHHDNPDEDLQTEYYNIESHPVPSSIDNKYTSLRLQFKLPQSTYATMLFRELTKMSSTTFNQLGISKNIK